MFNGEFHYTTGRVCGIIVFREQSRGVDVRHRKIFPSDECSRRRIEWIAREAGGKGVLLRLLALAVTRTAARRTKVHNRYSGFTG